VPRSPTRRLLGLFATAGLAACTAQPPNLLLISIDTLRPDHLASYGYERDTSPAIGRLARQGVLWEHAYAPSPATVASHASLFSGRHPYQHRTLNYASPLPDAERTLAEILGESGYRTFAVATSIRFHDGSGFAQGFEHYESLHEQPKNARGALATDRVLELVRSDDSRPFFGFVHYFGPHTPYWPPAEWRARWHKGAEPELPGGPGPYVHSRREPGQEVPLETLRYLEALYDAEISYLDSDLARLLDGLAAAGLADDTLVVLVSDHGEEFKEHGGLAHARTLFEEALRVPLLMRFPAELPGGLRVARPAQLVDVAPTVLELLGLPVPVDLPGRSLVEDVAPLVGDVASPGVRDGADVVLGQRGVRQWSISASLPEGRFKALFEQGAQPQLFQLDVDPGERRNLAPSRAEILRQLVASGPAEMVGGLEAGPTQEVPEDVRRRLAEIGYTEEVGETHE
jgi:arylsulfatase A-like enzyme